MSEKETALGIGENIEGTLCYFLGWLTGVFFLILEEKNRFIRFHAMQSLVVFLGLFIVSIVAGWVPLIGWLISILIVPISLVLWGLLMFKAFQGELFKLPRIGEFAEEKISELNGSKDLEE